MLDGVRLEFGFHGIWQGTALLYDRDTGSLWLHLTGECIEGPRRGRRLRTLDTGRHTRWQEWRETHPEGDVMRPDPRFAREYFPRDVSRAGDPYLSPEFARTIRARDPRLALSDLLLGVLPGGAPPRAYPYARLAATSGVVEEPLGPVQATVWFDAAARTSVAFDRMLAGELLTFERLDGPEALGLHQGARFRDRETGSLWNLEGVAVAGRHEGRRLRRLPCLQAEWYGWFAHHPDTTVFSR